MTRPVRPHASRTLWARTLIVFLSAVSFYSLSLLAQPAGKRPLAHTDYDTWRAIQLQQLSRDGKLLAYALNPQVMWCGDAEGWGTPRRLRITRDGGKTWKLFYDCYCRAVWVDPLDSEHIILGSADHVDSNGRIEESRDGGQTCQCLGSRVAVGGPVGNLVRPERAGASPFSLPGHRLSRG